MYAVTAVRRIVERHGSCETVTACQLPTFWLDENVHGITNEGHAERVARCLLGATGAQYGLYSVCAVKL